VRTKWSRPDMGSVFLAFAACCTSVSAAQCKNVSFEGKSITMIIGSSAGGGTDATGRLIATYLGKYLPGSPRIVVQNMPGANGIVSVNYIVHQTRPDGLTVLMGSESDIDPMIYRGSPNVRYDPRQMEVIGGASRGGSVIFIRAAAEQRLFNKSLPPILIGNVDQLPREAIQPAVWAIQYLGWNAKWVTGYPGTNDLMLALDRGEIDMTCTGNLFQIKDRLSSGELKLVNQTGTLQNGVSVSNPVFGKAPLFTDQLKGQIKQPVADEAFKFWETLNSADKWFALAPGTPEDILAAYRDAYQKMSEDKSFMSSSMKISDGFYSISGLEFAKMIDTLANTPDAALEYFRDLMRKQGLPAQ
jgi:hypothetical protein